MKFEVGDKVVVKHSNEDGVVKEIINEKMVLVEVRGVKFPAYTDQLDFPYFKMFTEGKKLAPAAPPKKYIDDIRKEKKAPKYKVAEGVWLLFFPVFSKDVFDDDVVEDLKIYLINQTDTGFKFHFWYRLKGETEMELQSEVFALSDMYLMNIEFEQLNDNPSFDFEFSLFNDDKTKAEYFEASYKPKAKQVFKQIELLKEKGEAFYNAQLFEKYPARTREEKPKYDERLAQNDKLRAAGFKVYDATKVRQHLPSAQSVVDLHIEKLTDQPGGLSNSEKLELQLNTFEKYFDLAQLNHLPELVVIHGIGKGTLRDEIHERLRYKQGVKSFVNQYHPWYGYGATQIFFGG